MKIIIAGILICLFYSCKVETNEEILHKQLIMIMEYSYFKGQKDALNGNFRIEKQDDSNFVWIKSPWDNTDKQPDYIPSLTLENNLKLIK